MSLRTSPLAIVAVYVFTVVVAPPSTSVVSESNVQESGTVTSIWSVTEEVPAKTPIIGIAATTAETAPAAIIDFFIFYSFCLSRFLF